MDPIDELLTRGVDKIYPSREALEKVLRSGKKLRLYLGIDPTGDKLHIGHTVALLKLRQFQDAGHHVILLIGDFTARIGDPTGKIAGARKQLTREEVLSNATSYKDQAGKILRFSPPNLVELRFNSEWLEKMTALDFLRLANLFSFQQIIERDMFQERIKGGQDVLANEFLYPLLQAYDSVELDVDVELGGSDQMFNMMVGRDLMKKMKHKEKFVLTVPILADSSGKKIGKTEGNVIGITDPPNDLFGKIMSLQDEIIVKGFELLTRIPMDEVESIKFQLEKDGVNPIELKKRLAYTLVSQYHSKPAADQAQEFFASTAGIKVQQLDNMDIPVHPMVSGGTIAGTAIESGLAGSTSDLKRMVKQGGFYYNNRRVTSEQLDDPVKEGDIIRRGSHRMVKVTYK